MCPKWGMKKRVLAAFVDRALSSHLIDESGSLGEGKMRGAIMLTMAAALVVAAPAYSASYMIGDNDGYGAGVCDNCDHSFNGSTAGWDGRSLAEIADADGIGLKYTDTYSTTHGTFSPADQTGSVATFLFGNLGNGWTVGHLEIDMADFQASTFGAVSTTFNGIVQDFSYNDGFPHTFIRFYSLTNDVLDSINNLGQLTIAIDRSGSVDFYGFDYLKLNDVANPVPEPETYAMLLAGLGLLGWHARRRKNKQVT